MKWVKCKPVYIRLENNVSYSTVYETKLNEFKSIYKNLKKRKSESWRQWIKEVLTAPIYFDVRTYLNDPKGIIG